MLCTFCNTARLDNEAPCPQCGAPSPLMSRTNTTSALSVGNGMGQPVPPLWDDNTASLPNASIGQRISPMLPQTPQLSFQSEQQQHVQQQSPISMLPAIYQPLQQQLNPSQTNSPPLGSGLIPVPMQHLSAMLPALPADESIVYVPPMYTKPRPIIPRYRAISGLLSILIVAILFCSGAGYYAKASGKLSSLTQLYGMVPPPSLKPTPMMPLPDPPNPIFGPAYSIINSATTNSRIDPSSHASAQPATIFQVNQTIYLTYSVQKPKTPGTVYIKWYTNGAFYESPAPIPLDKDAISGYATQKYVQPETGMVELYWNNQLAIRLYFVVR